MSTGTIEWQVKTMVTETSTYSDIVHLFGPIDDHLAREILDLQPSPAELEVVAAFQAGMTDVLGEERVPLTGNAARIYEIVSRDEVLPGEDEAPRA
jgi:hypothetical protein